MAENLRNQDGRVHPRQGQASQTPARGDVPRPQPQQAGQPMGAYSNPQSTQGRVPRQPRRAGQGRLYRRYVPAQGEEPPQLRKDYTGAISIPQSTVVQSQPEPQGRGRGVVVVLGVVAALAVVAGGAFAVNAILNPSDSAGANQELISSDGSSFDMDADTAMGILTNRTSATDADMITLTFLVPSMMNEYETIIETTPSAVEPNDVVAKVSVSGWEDEISGWPNLQLRVRASTWAMEELESRYGAKFVVQQAKVTGTSKPETVMLVCRCTTGENAGITVNATVGLSGSTPMMADDVDSAVSYKKGVLERLNAVLRTRGDLYPGDFALEGYTSPLKKEDGSMMRTETWWLYVNSNVAPQDINEFVQFVNDMHAAFVQTAGDDVVNVDLTVISCDANDPAMGGKKFSELAAELATTNDPGGRYMDFDYVLRGQASSTTPCIEADLDGRLHPYSWDSSESI